MTIIQKVNKVIDTEIKNLRDPKKNPSGYKKWCAKDNRKAFRAVLRFATGY